MIVISPCQLDGSLLTEEAKILSLMEKHENLVINICIYEEISFLQSVSKVNLVGVCVGAAEKSSFKIIVEFCSHGNLRNVLKQHKKSFVEIQFESIKLNQSNEAKFKELIGRYRNVLNMSKLNTHVMFYRPMYRKENCHNTIIIWNFTTKNLVVNISTPFVMVDNS